MLLAPKRSGTPNPPEQCRFERVNRKQRISNLLMEVNMRRIRLTVTAFAAVAVMAGVTAGSAAAVTGVLCSTAPLSHECGTSTYPQGTEVTATLTPNTYMRVRDAFNDTIAQCVDASISMRYEYNSLRVTDWSFNNCINGTINSTKAYQWFDLKWKEGTDNALFTATGSGLYVIHNKLGSTGDRAFSGTGVELVGGSPASLKFTKAVLKYTGGESWWTYDLYFDGSFQITSPSPLYIEKP